MYFLCNSASETYPVSYTFLIKERILIHFTPALRVVDVTGVLLQIYTGWTLNES